MLENWNSFDEVYEVVYDTDVNVINGKDEHATFEKFIQNEPALWDSSQSVLRYKFKEGVALGRIGVKLNV